ncbi:hypothetical protein CPB86DRAFT_570813 [Serendipita vermifera]|nr:hypothetical protein CPB86DRAFT_570813 [Serendipita vermifera]
MAFIQFISGMLNVAVQRVVSYSNNRIQTARKSTGQGLIVAILNLLSTLLGLSAWVDDLCECFSTIEMEPTHRI